MGIDVNLYATGDISEGDLERANRFLMDRRVFGGYSDDGPPLARSKYERDGRVEWTTLDRYYGPGYERGHWPAIHNAIACLRAALPHADVFYGGDTLPDAPLVTDEVVADIWAHWLSDQGQAYGEHFRRGRRAGVA